MKKIALFTAVFAMVLGGTALAADWNFYGSARMALWSVSADKDSATNPLTGTSDDYRYTDYNLQDNSRIGAKVAAGDISGRFEFGYFPAVQSASTTVKQAVRLRLLYGEWNFGSGSVLVGQDYGPANFAISSQIANWDQGLYQYGAPSNRLPQITFTFGGFKIGFVQPATATDTTATYSTARGTLPKIEAGYKGDFGPVKFGVGAGWNSVDLVDLATNNTISATSYMFNGYVKYAAGPFSIAGGGTYAINGSEYGNNSVTAVDAKGNIVGTEYKDNTTYGLQGVVAFKVNDMVGLEGGYAYVVGSDDGAANDDTAQSFYFQVPLTLADGVFLIPEYTLFDKMDSGGATKTKQGADSWIGLKFQINF